MTWCGPGLIVKNMSRLTRREFVKFTAAAAVLPGMRRVSAVGTPFSLQYMLPTPMYGKADLGTILAQVPRTGARFIDLWPAPHGNQREQLDAMGPTKLAAMLREHGVKLGATSRFDLMPFKVAPEIPVASQLGGKLIVGGSRGPRGLTGTALRDAVRDFARKLQPVADAAGAAGVTLAIENHVGSLIASPDSIRWFAEFVTHPHVGLAFGPHHLPQDPAIQAKLIEDLGPKIALFYAQQRGHGADHAMSTDELLRQMPGRGPLDFGPLVAALVKIRFAGFTEIYMHTYPRGLPIRPTPEGVTAEVNRSRAYLDALIPKD